jgi:tetratricopeptide (TPR) repeat protein
MARGQSVARVSDSLLQRVTALMAERRWREAVAACASASASDRTPDVRWNWAWAHFKLGELSTARALLEEVVTNRPDHPASLWALGVVLHQLGVRKEARARLERSLELSDSTPARLALALLLMEDKDFATAERVHLAGIKLKPTSAERLEAYGDFLSDTGRPEEAAALYARAKRLRA